jgi:hypothetical protein
VIRQDATSRPSGRRRSSIATLWLAKLAFLALVAFLIGRNFDVARFRSAISGVGLLPLLAALAVDVPFYLVETARLVYLSGGAYPFGVLLRSRYLSALIGTVLPGLAAADLVRVFLIDRTHPGNKTGILVLLLGNRVYGLISLVSLGIVALSQPGGETLLGRAHGWLPVSAVSVAVLTLPLWIRFAPFQRLCLALVGKLPDALARPGSRALEALLTMTSVRQWLFAIVTCTITNLLVVCEFWLLGGAVHVPVSFAQWCLLVPFIAVATMLPLGIGAIGTQEAALLAASRMIAVPFEPLLLVSAGMHLVRIGATLPGLAFSRDALLTLQQVRGTRRRPGGLREGMDHP